MTTLTSSASIAIAIAPAPATAQAALTVLPLAAPGAGRGRLEHPTLGVYHYPACPDEWTNLDGDLLVPPAWSHAATLTAGADVLWAGNLRDVEVEERWTSEALALEHLRRLAAIWTNPPDPASGAVTWWPEYSTTLGYKVAVTGLSAGGEQVLFDYLARQGYARGPIVLKMRILGRA